MRWRWLGVTLYIKITSEPQMSWPKWSRRARVRAYTRAALMSVAVTLMSTSTARVTRVTNEERVGGKMCWPQVKPT